MCNRITPACAGNTDTLKQAVSDNKNHSCVCRKYIIKFETGHDYRESLLRVQEILVPLLFSGHCSRITPACAGNTVIMYVKLARNKNHSCVCRKYSVSAFNVLIGKESLLRVQEIPVVIVVVVVVSRITPACAGNTHLLSRVSERIQNHSCVCRKYCVCCNVVWSVVESLLRVQEIRCYSFKIIKMFRITPACAGNTEFWEVNLYLIQNHSCVCRKYNH